MEWQIPSPYAAHWTLDPAVTFLNHGSFGACPRSVLAEQTRLRAQLERQPVAFFLRSYQPLLRTAREALGAFLAADADDLAFVSNATTGVNAVLRSLALNPGDEVICIDHAYNACANALRFVAKRAGARVVTATLPWPVESPADCVQAIAEVVTPRTVLALIDHITSPTGIVLPIAEIVQALKAKGVETLVGGAHAPGMLPLQLNELGAAYYVGNAHKWLCAPNGVGFLHVRRDLQDTVRPTVISHGANMSVSGMSAFRLEFDWAGTADPTPALCLPESFRFFDAVLPGGMAEVMARNRALALRARRTLENALSVRPLCPEACIGSLAAVRLPPASTPAAPPLGMDPLQEALYQRYRIEVPIIRWPGASERLVRISAQLYNDPSQYEALADALQVLLAEETGAR